MTAPEESQDPQDLEATEETTDEVETEVTDDDEETGESNDLNDEAEESPPPPALITITLKENPGGMVDAQLLIGLKPSEELLGELAARDFENPHFIVTVTSITEEDRYGRGETTESHRQTSGYVTPVGKPFPYVRFAQPGRNRICVTVVDIRSEHSEKWADKVRANTKQLTDTDGKFNARYVGPSCAGVIWAGLGSKDVIVPKELFSDPSGWRKTLVQQFWPQLGADDCKFRSKVFRAAIMSFFVQLYGLLIARPATLLTAAVMLKREAWQRRRMLLAFNPHSFWKMSGDSWWFTAKDGASRSNRPGLQKALPFVSPPVLSGIAAVFLGIPSIIYGIADISMYGMGDVRKAAVWADNWGYWHSVFVLDKWILYIAVVGAVVSTIGWLLAALVSRLRKGVSHEETEEERLARLRSRLVDVPEDGPDWNSLPDSQKTVRLRFANFKAKVCRPIAT